MLEREDLERIVSRATIEREYEELLIDSGELRFTREDLRLMGCTRYIAASYLNTRVLHKLKITTLKQLYDTAPIDIARMKGIGEGVIHNIVAILAAHEYDIREWWSSSGVKYQTLHTRATRRAKSRERAKGGE